MARPLRRARHRRLRKHRRRFLAANAALLSFRRPEATVAPDTQRVTVHPADVREPIPLALHHLPVAFTFGFFAEHDGLVIVDPTVKEEAVMGSELVVVLNAHNELCAVQKGGGSAVNPSEVMMPRCRVADDQGRHRRALKRRTPRGRRRGISDA